MPESQPYVHLHVHSEYSILDGACRIEPLVARAAELGMPAVGLTDHGSMAGAVELSRAAAKAGIRPILGCEMYVVDDHATRVQKERRSHLTLLAETTAGYHNLVRLVSAAYLDGYWYRPRVDLAQLAAHADGIVALSGCLSGRVCKALVDGDEGLARRELDDLVQVFGRDQVYVELQDGGIDIQSRINPRLAALAADAGLPLVGTGDVHYLTADDAIPHEALLCIQTNDTLDNPGRFRFSNHGFYLKSPQEMYALMAGPWGEDMLRRTVEIAERCEVRIDLDALHLPRFDVPAGRTAVEYMRELAEAGLRERYGTETPELRQRLEFELRTIEEMGFPDYFLIVWDFIRFARSEGISVGPGRGSAAGSLVAYCLRITDLDPIRYSLLFERFLNPGRKTLPDVDVDFAVAGRERVINYVAEKYGRRNVAQIITFGKMQPKAAIKDAGRVMGIPYGVVDRIAKLVPEVPKITFAECMKSGAELRRAYDTDETTRKIVDMAQPLEGVVRNDSIHAAAVVIGDRPLTEYLPLQQKGSDSEVVTQFAMGDVDALGLLKMDFLGLRNLDVIDRAIDLIEQSRGVRLDMDTLPLDDAATYEMMARGEATGVFQFESSGMRDALRLVRPTEFEDLVALNALYRPGPMQFIPDYARNKRDPSRVTYEDERLRPILESTHGTCLTGDTLVMDARTGRRRRLDQISGGDDMLVQGVDDRMRPAFAPVTHWFDNGERPVYELRLRNGASVKATADHLFLTESGWCELRHLAPGEFVGTPPALTALQSRSLSTVERDRYAVLAYLLADGCLASGNVGLTSADPALLADFRVRCRSGFPGTTISLHEQVRGVKRATVRKDPACALPYHQASALEMWLRERGLRWLPPHSGPKGPASAEKWVPEDVFELADDEIARFLAVLWDCDGHVSTQTVHYKTISERLAHDVQTLLLRIGIRSVIHRSTYRTSRNGESGERTAYQVTVSGTGAFGRQIQPYLLTEKRAVHTGSRDRSMTIDRPHVLAELYTATDDLPPMEGRRSRAGHISVRDIEARFGFSRQHVYGPSTLPDRIGNRYVEPLLATLEMPRTACLAEVAWVEIAEIRPAGTERVFDITVDGIHNFVANNVIAHNCIYQEQFMEIAKSIAGFTPAEADDLRKAIGKKIQSLMASLKEKFIEGCVRNGASEAVGRSLWAKIEVAADYAFNKAHAACYALVAYRTAYLRANYRAEYMAALISSVMSTKDRVPFYVTECADMSLEVLPPDVNTSRSDFSVVDGRIRFGLSAVKRVGEGAVRAIIAARDDRPIESIWDFCERVDMSVVNRGMLESLIACGALDSTGATRAGMTDVLERALANGQKVQADAMVGQGSIFDLEATDGNGSGPSSRSHPPIVADEWPRDELLRREKEVLGLYVSSHPLAPLREQLSRKVDVPLKALHELPDGKVVTVGGIVAGLRQLLTKKGDQMAFIELDDISSTGEVVVFANTWETAREILRPDAIVLVKARVDRRSESEVKLRALEVTPFEAVPDSDVVRLRVDARVVAAGVMDELKTLIGEYPGPAPVELEVQTSSGPKMLRLGPGFRVRADGDFLAEARALLGAAALV